MKFFSSIKYLRSPKTENKNKDMTENIEDKYPDTKKPFLKYKSSLREEHAYLASVNKQAGPLMDRLNKEQQKGEPTGPLADRLNKTKTQEQGNIQKLSGLIQGAIDKFRSLVFEVAGTDQVIEVAKSGNGVEMKVFEDKDSPTPSKEKKFGFNDFVTFFLNKLASNNAEKVAQELSSKGIAQVSKPVLASVKAFLQKKSNEDFSEYYDSDGNLSDKPMFLVNKTYEIITQESAEDSDVEDSGFEFKDEPMSPEELKYELSQENYLEWSNSDKTGWLSTVTPVEDRDYFEKGIEKYYSLHFKKLDGSPLEKKDYAFIDSLLR